MNNKNNFLTIEKCLSMVDLIDIYITKNILKLINKKKSIEFIKKNIFLLGVTNKNNKNSLIILLENGKYEFINKLIEYDFNILSYKNIHENNLLKSLLAYDYFYDPILNYINKYDKDFVTKILTDVNNIGINFIDNFIMLINFGNETFEKINISMSHEQYNNDIILKLNDKNNNNNNDNDNDSMIIKNNFGNNILIKKLINIGKNIYLLDNEKKTLLITKLCKSINNENYLLDILKFFNIDNFDIFPDANMLNCIDYLIINDYFDCMSYLLDCINYIEFINVDDNLIFIFLQNTQVDIKIRSNIILKIISKSNISKFKNNKNQNIFYFLIRDFGIDIETLLKFIGIVDIYEQDIYGKSLYDLILVSYSEKNIKLFNSLINKKTINFSYSYSDLEKINKKINIKSRLIKSNIGIFTSNIIHNMLYTVNLLELNNKYLTIPCFEQSDSFRIEQEKLLSMSNNEKNILSYLKLYFTNFNTWVPHLILWKNKNNYWIDPNLIKLVEDKKKSIRFIYIKLSVYLLDNTNTRHSNCIIIDNIKKTVERFEPYGEMIFTNSKDINKMIETKISKPLGYNFVFVQPYPGFQSRSDEYSKFNKAYGDPMGFCLAWSFLYIYIKLALFKNNSSINPIDYINWYVINKFEKDFDINTEQNKTNKYILFIRYFAMYLDKEKNKLIQEYNLDSGLSYQADFDLDYHNKIIININKNLKKIVIDNKYLKKNKK